MGAPRRSASPPWPGLERRPRLGAEVEVEAGGNG